MSLHALCFFSKKKTLSIEKDEQTNKKELKGGKHEMINKGKTNSNKENEIMEKYIENKISQIY